MSLTKHLILCGFMACGKSTVGALCADLLQVPFSDTDALIEAQAGMTIPQLFAKFGEDDFRDREHALFLSLPALSPRVIATGGGLPTFARNLPALRAAGTVVFIDRSFDTIYDSIQRKQNRPLANGKQKEEVRALYDRRYPLYRAAADYVVISDGEAIDCARKILQLPL